MLKISMFFLSILLPISSFATVEFAGGGWYYGTAAAETIKAVGISSDENGETRVVLNVANDRQVKLSGTHTALGLSLTGYQGKCIQIIPGYKFQSVSFILTCP
jgi:hypothetical protein